MVSAATFFLCLVLFYFATTACRGLYHFIAVGAGWPYL